MLIRTTRDDYEKIAYDYDEKNHSIMGASNICDLFRPEALNNDSDEVSDFVDKLVSFIRAERSDWGNKEVYLNFEEIEYLITSAKILYDRYKSGIF